MWKNKYVFLKSFEKKSIQQVLILEWIICCPVVINVSCNILGYHLMWPLQFVAILACGRFGLWSFRSVAISVCGHSGLWLFQFAIVSVVAFRFVVVMTCYRYRDYCPDSALWLRSQQIIWRSDTCRFPLWVIDLHMTFTTVRWYQDSNPSKDCQETCLVEICIQAI